MSVDYRSLALNNSVAEVDRVLSTPQFSSVRLSSRIYYDHFSRSEAPRWPIVINQSWQHICICMLSNSCKLVICFKFKVNGGLRVISERVTHPLTLSRSLVDCRVRLDRGFREGVSGIAGKARVFNWMLEGVVSSLVLPLLVVRNVHPGIPNMKYPELHFRVQLLTLTSIDRQPGLFWSTRTDQ